MKIMYISNRSVNNIGANLHFDALEEIVGRNSIIKINLRADATVVREDNYIAYGKYKSVAHRIGRWIQGNGMYMSHQIINDLCSIIKKEKVDIVFVEETFLGNLIKAIKNKNRNVKIIVFFHDIGADLYRQWRKRANWIGKIENTINLRQEQVTVKYADTLVVFHEEDNNRMLEYYGRPADIIIPLSSKPQPFIEKDTRCTGAKEKKTLLFVGSSYFPNILGMRWFYNNVLPKLNCDFELQIVGRGTESLRKEFIDNRVIVVGGVESMDLYYRNADIFIAPIFDGGGMKAKSIEAVSYAKCFVGTSNSLAGFWSQMDESVKNKIVFKCDTAEEWIDTMQTLLNSDIYKFNRGLYNIFNAKFSFEATKKLLAELLWEGEKK